MRRLIDARVAAAELAKIMAYEANMENSAAGYHYTKDDYIDIVEEWLENVPTIEAEPVRRGKWKRGGIKMSDFVFNCSECKSFTPYGIKTVYCPYCGAYMEGEE